MKELHLVTDLQFGSCGKGLFCGYLAQRIEADTVFTAWGSNAGHTYIGADGRKFVNIMLASSTVAPSIKRVMIGPGSILDPKILMSEIEHNADLLEGVQILIHEHAAVINEYHKGQEAGYAHKIGSTMKGVGAAVIQKITRDPDHSNVARDVLKGTPLEGYLASVEDYNHAVDQSSICMIEGAQGFSLSINQGFYPYTTSRDCTVSQLLTDCAIPGSVFGPMFRMKVYGVARTYPIRVANRFKDDKQIGWSGPHYFDQKEIEWADIGMEPELTTVTRLPRRIFTFSEEQIRQAVRMNGTDEVFLNFCNYDQTANGRTVSEIVDVIERAGAEVRWLGYGPNVQDIQEVA